VKFFIVSLTLICFITTNVFGQVAQNGIIENADARFGRIYDRLVGNRTCDPHANLDEYRQVRCGLQVQGHLGYMHDGDNSWGDNSLTPAVFQQVTDNIVFQTAALDVYKFNQCQVSFYRNYRNDPQKHTDMQERAWVAFSQIKTELRGEVNSVDTISEDRDRQLRAAAMSTAPTSDGRITNIYERASTAKGPHEAEIAKLCASVPLGNRDAMKSFLQRAARQNMNESAFKAAYHQVVLNQLTSEANSAFSRIDALSNPGTDPDHPIFDINMRTKRDLMQTGVIDNLLVDNNLESFAESEYMCRYRSQERGEIVHTGAQILLAAVMMAISGGLFTPYFIATMRIASYARSAISTAIGSTRAGQLIRSGGQLSTNVTKAIGRGITSSHAGRLLLGGLATYDVATVYADVNRECFSSEYLTSKSHPSCNAEKQYYEIMAEANTAGCLIGLVGFGAASIDTIQSIRRINRLSGGDQDAVDDLMEVTTSRIERRLANDVEIPSSQTIQVQGEFTPSDFALTREQVQAARTELRAKGIIPGETNLTPEQLAELTPNQRVVFFEDISGTALTPSQKTQLEEIYTGNLSLIRRNQRLRTLLRAGDDNFTPTEIEGIIRRLDDSGIVPSRVSTPNPSAATPPPQASQIVEDDFMNNYYLRTNSTPEQNANFIRLARATDNPPGLFFLDIQNQRLKELNDMLDNKPLIDAINNKHHEIVQDALAGFRARHPDIDFNIETYSDYKGIRFAIQGPPGQESRYMQEISAMMENVEVEFTAFLNNRGLTSLTDSARGENWFGFGVARTADQANVQARFPPGTSWKTIRDSWKHVEDYRKNIEEVWGNSPLMMQITNGISRVPTPEVFELLRKKNNPGEIARILNRRYNLDPRMNTAHATELMMYFNRVDDFSPGLLIESRVQHNFDLADNGGLTIDFAGVGSHNAQATAEALSRGITLEQAIVRTRRLEAEYTARLDEIKEGARSALEAVFTRHNIRGEITISGDDLVAIPNQPLSREIRDEIVLEQARNNVPSSMRISFFRDGIDNTSTRAIVATEGEGFEKALRSRLEGVLTPAEQRSLVFATDMQGAQYGEGGVRLITNGGLSPARMRVVYEQFSEVVGPRAIVPIFN
tara:strand:- start:6102 stop:9452 length:3351 start_codon:yes stop_codon:yes gene_type:complete